MTRQQDSDVKASDAQAAIARPANTVPAPADAQDEESAVPLQLAIFGASAGGVDALSRLAANLPENAPFASVVLTHLDPNQESHLVEVLQRHAPLPVQWLEDGGTIEPSRIHVLPPGQLARLADRTISLSPRPPGPNFPIDHFMISASQDAGVQVAAVVLSGTGNDGSAGAMAIQAVGGLVIAQDPDDAAHEGMPLALIDEQMADRVLAPEAIGEALLQYFAPPARTPADEARHAADALALVRAQFGLDLTYYKDVNVRRRLLRRAFLQSGGDLDAYLQLLRHKPEELAVLRDDLLIGVTAFFRDDEFVAALERHVLPDLIDRSAEAIRVWVPACSTGEEAYSIAMLLHHMLEAAGITRKVQIFGSDVNEAAVRHARAGRYSGTAVASLPEFYRARYLEKDANGWRVVKAVRELCLFAVHNVFTNAPFSNVDLVSARNFLIYVRKTAKRAAFEVFFYALRRGGYLVLGPSETPDPELFDDSASGVNLYRRRQITRPPIRGLAFTEFPTAAVAGHHDPGTTSLESLVDRLALARYAPPGFVVDLNGRVVQFRGDTSPLLQPTGGDATLSLAKLVRPELQVDVRAALMEAVRSKLPVRRERVRLGDKHCALDVVPVPAGGSERYFLVSVQDCEPTALPPLEAASDARAEDLERYVRVLGEELEQTRAQLKAVVTEYDATGEELRTANEEILSSNEELQSANEDLKDAKRDLETANADLTALNRELQQRNDQLVWLNDDLGNLIRGIPVPVLMLDRDQCVRHYSPAAAELFAFGDDGAGQPLKSSPSFAPDVLNAAVDEALRELRPVEREVQDRAGRWYVLSARAYQTSENRIEGAVLALQDVHHLKLALETANLARAEAERANAAKNDFLALVSHELRAPLNIISNWIQLLRTLRVERDGDARVGQALAAVERSCKDQARLIDDLLDISRITSGKLVLDLRPTDFAAVTRAMLEAVEPLAGAKAIELSSSGLGEPVMLAGDMRRLQQIVANVLENAVKFTPRGGHVDVALVRLDTFAELTVGDTGMGITADELPRIFERFSQGDISKTRRHGGLGLGLSIVRNLVEAHGGSVAAMSDGRDRGARFVVRLPLSPTSLARADPAPRPLSATALSLNGISILLVDDEPSGRDALAHMLAAIGADVEVAGSAAEALEKLERRAFDALIADIAMPGTDGHQLIRDVRRRDGDGAARSIYAIALTGFTSAGEREEALAAGYDAHFGKPPDIAEIAARAAAGVRARDPSRAPD